MDYALQNTCPASYVLYYTVRACTRDSTNKIVRQKSHTLYAMIDTLISIFKFDKCEFITFMGTCERRTENTFHEAYATVWLFNFSCGNNSSSLPVTTSRQFPTHSPQQLPNLLYHATTVFSCWHKSVYSAVTCRFINLPKLQLSLNLWPPGLCVSSRIGWQALPVRSGS